VHGVALPKVRDKNGHAPSWTSRLKAIALANKLFLAIVVLPTLLLTFYYVLIASDQYESNTDFVVRHAESNANSGGFGQLLGFSFGSSATSSESYMVQEYLLSHDAVARLRAHDDLVGIFRRDGTDWISRLWGSDPSPERLLKFFRHQVTMRQDETSGIVHLTVHTFRRRDSYGVTRMLLQMGEEQINLINQRTYNDQVANSQRELAEANRQLLETQAQLTSYRRVHEDIDPEGTGKAQVNMVSNLTANLVEARARLQAMEGVIRHSSPQYLAMSRQVQALASQIAGQNGKLAGPNHSIATRLSDYEQLVIQREQVAKTYAAAAAQFEQAKADAKRKQLYLIRVVNPNLPVKSEYPKRFQTILTAFTSLLFAYAIGWLLWAGVKEHSL
jgi:capsular polysaccharide transport system permease protein